MKHNYRRFRLLLVILRVALVLALLPAPGAGYAQEGMTAQLIETSIPWPIAELSAASHLLVNRPPDILPGPTSSLIFTSLDHSPDGNWAIATVVMRPNPLPERYETLLDYPGRLVLLRKVDMGNWQVNIEGTSVFSTTLMEIPPDFISTDAKYDLLHLDVERGLPSSLNLKWPWKSGQTWVYMNGPHKSWDGAGTTDAVDFAPYHAIPGSDREVRAAATGTVFKKCVDSIQSDIYLSHANNSYTTGYLHVDKNSASHIGVGSQPKQGDRLGHTYNASNFGSTCGYGTGPHLHFHVGVNPPNDQRTNIVGTVISGWTLGSSCFSKSGESSKCVGNDITSDNGGGSTPSCPSDNNVVTLYKHHNYDCGGGGDGDGYVKANRNSSTQIPGGFGASSIRIPSGWYAKVFERDGNGKRLYIGSDNNFDGDFFDNGHPVNDRVGGVEVGDSLTCSGRASPENCLQPNRAPNRPSPTSPDDWYVARDSRAPNLCWNNNGDPDGDSVEFYAEVFDSAKGANSGWTRDTCWRPGELDGNYFNYQWRVKAKDSRGAESGWSDVRHFTIEAPNKPPTIDFQTANGNGDSRITTREQNWKFEGTAGDPENQFSRVEFRCGDCDNRGSGDDRSTSTSWTITRNGMSGRNFVYFEAFDDRQSTKSRTLELNIDLAPPTTDIQINGKSPNDWPQWFTEAAQVRLTGRDNSTGRVVADVREVRYRRDGGGEQVQSGATVNFTESGDGEHTVRFYSIDNVGNVESEVSWTYRIDRTPPTAITGLSESSGVANNQWQKAQNKPTFTWNASSDALSGLGGYQFYFGPDANGEVVHFDVSATDNRTLTPNNLGVATGTYYLRGRTWDRAGNKSVWQSLFTFRYDGTPPPNPGQATHLNGPKNDTWQKITASPNFTWTAPLDEGSGVKGYLLYWGNNENGESGNFVTTNSFASTTPLCAAGQACTGYLRLRSQDNVDWQAEKWSTTFVLRYDGAPPVADFTVNNGVTQTAQTLLQLNLRATDAGSGLREMRFSNDGQTWTPWEVYAESRVWEIPGISRQYWPIYAQVKDGVGWESAVVSRTIYFDVNVNRPRSANYRLFDWADVAGAGSHTSQPTGYKGHSTVGQVLDSPRITSTNYLLRGGYQAGSRAIPLVVPGHDEFEYINSIFASGVVNTTLQSVSYRMIGVWGEPGLPNNSTELTSASYRFQPGFLAARPSPKETPVPTPTSTPGPTPTPTPTPACDFPRVSIDNGAVFTTDTGVTLSLCAPRATEMMVSNDGGFAGAVWETYNRSRAWTLTSHSNYVLPRFVYAAFKDAAGQVYATYLDDIILDPTPPEAKVRVGTDLPLDTALLAAARSGRESIPLFHAQAATYLWELNGQPLAEPIPLLAAGADGVVDLYLSARDAVGTVTRMQVSDTGSFGGAWESYSALKAYTPSGGDGLKTVYARFQDEAGNTSQPVTATFALDSLPPVGGIALSHPILGPDVVTTTVWLGAEDNLSGVAAMRLSSDPTFADAVWRPFASTLPWVYSQADRSAAALHVQFRDNAGNQSQVYAAPLLVDSTPPLVYVEVEAGETLTRTVRVYSYDELTYPAQMRITNDPLFLDGVVTQPYADSLTWTFDARRVVWVQVQDGVGNWGEPYPAYAELPETPGTQYQLYLPSIQAILPGQE